MWFWGKSRQSNEATGPRGLGSNMIVAEAYCNKVRVTANTELRAGDKIFVKLIAVDDGLADVSLFINGQEVAKEQRVLVDRGMGSCNLRIPRNVSWLKKAEINVAFTRSGTGDLKVYYSPAVGFKVTF